MLAVLCSLANGVSESAPARLGGLSPRLFIAARACRSAPPTLRPPDKKKPRSRGEDRGFLGSIWGEPAMTREGHRNNQIVIPDLSSTLFCVTFFPHPDGNLPLEMWAASVSPRWPFALVGDFSR